MAAVFVSLRLSVLGAECEVVSLNRTHVTETAQCCFDLQDSLPGCWGGQVSCELALRRTSYS